VRSVSAFFACWWSKNSFAASRSVHRPIAASALSVAFCTGGSIPRSSSAAASRAFLLASARPTRGYGPRPASRTLPPNV
jgi:hypothetical protein